MVGAPNRPVEIYRGKMRIQTEGWTCTGRGVLRLEYLPAPRIALRLNVDPSAIQPNLPTSITSLLSQAELFLGSSSNPIPVVVSGTTIGRTTTISGRLKGRTARGTGKDIQRIVFQLINFHDYLGSAIKLEQQLWKGRLFLRSAVYGVTLDSVPDLAQTTRSLRGTGGYAVTHVGLVERTDGNVFSPSDVRDIVEALFWFFSFARGFSSAPSLPVGLTSAGKRVWQDWFHPRATRWGGWDSWFDETRAAALADIFSPFMGFWSDPTMREVLTSAIHWYIEANTVAGGVEGSIILVQAALELLATVIVVERMNIYSAKDFDKLRADQRITTLLDRCRIPTGLPFSLTAVPVSTGLNGPSLLTTLRNALVHSKLPKRLALRNFSFDTRVELMKLGLWYVELVLLWLFDYKGDYLNRLNEDRWAGQVEPVPWAP